MKQFLKLLFRNRLAAMGAVVLSIIVVLAVLTPVLPLPDPNVTNTADRFAPPFSEGYLLGADHLGRGARLGFHQYRMDSTAYIPNVDIAEEQSRDRSFFERQAIDPEFLTRIFNSPHNAIWYPERSELEAAGVITKPD